MNKAFEKILERFGELHERYVNQYGVVGGNPMAFSVKECIEIVQEVAEEYNVGWIPCSERLPEEYTVLCCDKYGEMIVGHPYFDEVSDTNYSAESDNEMMYNCVAWQPLPEPFKESD